MMRAVFSLFLFTVCTVVAMGQNYKALHNVWGDIAYEGEPWTKNLSKPNKITRGLAGRHLSLWASHGAIYDNDKNSWRWQRPNLFCTTEDLFTQTIVVPYLIPMLENAGAVVFTPRERDWQRNEVVIDNDDVRSGVRYFEYNGKQKWKTADAKAFAQHDGCYSFGENPFEKGTLRYAKTTRGKNLSVASYQPDLPEDGRYAVYVSYKSLPKSIDNARYLVYHKGQATWFSVNQQIGGGTWVYLGTFDFDKGSSEKNRVVLTNFSKSKGVVSTDAVRFGGGMGNMQRGGYASGLPRCLEGARYYAQWAGAPLSVYSGNGSSSDYSDDINARSLMTNWLVGGSVYAPSIEGLGVPMELAIAVHSDAGYARDGKSLLGTLAICTTNFNGGILNSGITRMASKQLASDLLTNTFDDIASKYGNWARRYLWDRNYSETRMPEVPSAIIETLSHQNFPDMKMAQDPNFKFTLARSIYKTLLKFVQRQHGCEYTVQPLPPKNFRIEFDDNGKAVLSWDAQKDSREPSATPSSYIIYMAQGDGGFDNGTNVKRASHAVELAPGIVYSFKVTACNDGGESFPTQVLCAMRQPNATQTVLIIDGFERLSAPAVIDDGTRQGFDLDADPGVPYGLYAGWNGRQQVFDKNRMGTVGPNGLGYSGDELAGQFVMGNTFDYTFDHAKAIASTGRFNIASCAKSAVEDGSVDLRRYQCVDLFFGLQKYTPYAMEYYKTFTENLRKSVKSYTTAGGSMIVSGAYLGEDMGEEQERTFMKEVLKTEYANQNDSTDGRSLFGLGLNFDICKRLNARHYAATSVETITPTTDAICAMQYNGGAGAATAYSGADYKCFTMGFPFECITSDTMKKKLMAGILNYLVKK